MHKEKLNNFSSFLSLSPMTISQIDFIIFVNIYNISSLRGQMHIQKRKKCVLYAAFNLLGTTAPERNLPNPHLIIDIDIN